MNMLRFSWPISWQNYTIKKWYRQDAEKVSYCSEKNEVLVLEVNINMKQSLR